MGEGGKNWEIGIDIYTLPCVKQIASGNMLYSTGSSARCSVFLWNGGWVRSLKINGYSRNEQCLENIRGLV